MEDEYEGEIHGTEEGDLCNRSGCSGFMVIEADEECRCHEGSPPCNSCKEARLVCNLCGHDKNADDQQTFNEINQQWPRPKR